MLPNSTAILPPTLYPMTASTTTVAGDATLVTPPAQGFFDFGPNNGLGEDILWEVHMWLDHLESS